MTAGGVTRPVFADPDSVTHWTCPAAPHEGMTHHLIPTGPVAAREETCRYCKRGQGELREEQAQIQRGEQK